MKKQLLVSTIVLILCVAFLFPAHLSGQETIRKEGRYYIADIQKEFKVNAGGNLTMEGIRGDVDISTWSKNIVRIHEVRKMDVYTEEEAKAVLKDLKSVYQQNGNTIKVGAEGTYRKYMNSEFIVKLPVSFNVDVGTKGGDIKVADLKGAVHLATSGGDVDLMNIDGEVNAKTSGGDITINKTSKAANVKTSGGDIEITDVDGEVNAKTSGGDIMVKNNKSNVNVKTSGGTINLYNVGAKIDAHTSGGDVVVNGSKGALSVSTSGGDIKLQNIGGVIQARTSGGDIEGNNIMDGITASTSGGDIELRDVKGFIEAATSGGDIDAEMTLKDFSRDHHVELKSSGGDIVLRVPENLPATIDATIKVSGFSRSDYNIYSDFPLKLQKAEAEKKRGIREIRGEGSINGGGDQIKIITSNGNIEIKKLK